MAEQFWERWSRCMFPGCKSDSVGRKQCLTLKKILLKDSESEGRREFSKAVIEKVYPDENGYVRTAKVVLADGRVFNRDVRSMVHL